MFFGFYLHPYNTILPIFCCIFFERDSIPWLVGSVFAPKVTHLLTYDHVIIREHDIV